MGKLPVITLLRTVLPDCDPVKEVEEMWTARNAEASEEDEKALRPDREKRKDGDFDDSIPF